MEKQCYNKIIILLEIGSVLKSRFDAFYMFLT